MGGNTEIHTRNNPHGVGIDVGWRTAHDTHWWGNTRDANSLRLLIDDCRRHGYTYPLSEETAARIAPVAVKE